MSHKITISSDLDRPGGDEQIQISVDGVEIFTPNHEDEGWHGMLRMIALTKALAEKLGAEVADTQYIV